MPAALAVVALAVAVVPHLGRGYALVAAVVAVVALAAARVDRRERRIPNRLVAVGSVAVAAAVAVAGAVDHRAAAAAVGALAGVGGFAGPLLVLHLAAPGGLGLGDVKLGVVLGGGLGAAHPVLAPVGLLAGILVALVARVVRRRWHGPEPFAPALAAGAIVTLGLAMPTVRALGLGAFS